MSEPIETPVVAPESTPAKTFTQDEVDAIVSKRLAKAMKGVPNDEELSAYRSWKESQQTEQERWNNLTKERDTANGKVSSLTAELEQAKRDNYILSKGLTGDEAEFIAFKAAKMVDDKTTFEAAVDQLTAEREKKPAFDWTAPVGGGSAKPNVNDVMNSIIRGARK